MRWIDSFRQRDRWREDDGSLCVSVELREAGHRRRDDSPEASVVTLSTGRMLIRARRGTTLREIGEAILAAGEKFEADAR